MPVIPIKPILDTADKYHYGQGAFNVNSVSQIKAAIEIHEILRSPAIIQGAELANGFMGGRVDFKNSTIDDIRRGARNIGEAVWKYAEHAKIPVVLHLDHGTNLEVVKACIDGGYTSVMIDGSSKSFEENMEITREVVKYAHARGVSVEGELGVLAGVEDHVFSSQSTYTNPLDALEFIKKTGVDSLAISYGTMHGPNKGKNVKLRREILIAIKEILRLEGLQCSMVSHGSSTIPRYLVEDLKVLGSNMPDAEGISVHEIQKAIRSGIAKINVDTDIRMAVTRNMREYFNLHEDKQKSFSIGGVYKDLKNHPDVVDPRQVFGSIMDSVMTGTMSDSDVADLNKEVEKGVMEILAQLITSFGSAGKMNLVECKSLENMKKIYI
ncbi:ketose-bisphosphate aldolase [Proteiniclasticum sp. C24MP]|uniref:class II fructose-bisphosphate aldolase n=1 Tax=Proteiniclasticum sp. C24MP TaxID=3374101 RepID=UPI00375519C8